MVEQGFIVIPLTFEDNVYRTRDVRAQKLRTCGISFSPEVHAYIANAHLTKTKKHNEALVIVHVDPQVRTVPMSVSQFLIMVTQYGLVDTTLEQACSLRMPFRNVHLQALGLNTVTLTVSAHNQPGAHLLLCEHEGPRIEIADPLNGTMIGPGMGFGFGVSIEG